MNLESFLSSSDAGRVNNTLQKLALHEPNSPALAGGLAIELQIARAGRRTLMRQLNDIDFIAPAFDDLPRVFACDLLFRHVHPGDPPGGMILQAIDPETRLRIDVFRAYGTEMERVVEAHFGGVVVRMVSLEDSLARHARLCWDLTEGRTVAPKVARDFLRMVDLVCLNEIQAIWHEHRKPQMPPIFAEVLAQLRKVIQARPDLLIAPKYSTNPNEVCKRCADSTDFPIVAPARILSILGYC